MLLKPKNWSVFQHYKDRSPPWIKLHRDILNDRQYMCLPIASKALAPMLWLLASECKEGVFDASVEELHFRLRMDEKDIKVGIKALIDSGFFVIVSEMLAPCYQDAIPEREGEAEKETETKKENKTNAEALDGFDEFWAIYEKKGNKMQSQKAWKKLKPSIELQLEIYAQARLYVQATPDKQFRKDASTWLNNHCWKDVLNPAKPKPKGFFAQLGMIGENYEQSQPPIALGLDR
jgi:hypothetical protein